MKIFNSFFTNHIQKRITDKAQGKTTLAKIKQSIGKLSSRLSPFTNMKDYTGKIERLDSIKKVSLKLSDFKNGTFRVNTEGGGLIIDKNGQTVFNAAREFNRGNIGVSYSDGNIVIKKTTHPEDAKQEVYEYAQQAKFLGKNAVQYTHFRDEKGLIYIATKQYEGNLHDLIRNLRSEKNRGQLNKTIHSLTDGINRIYLQLLDLQENQNCDVCFTDLKPENLFFNSHEKGKVDIVVGDSAVIPKHDNHRLADLMLKFETAYSQQIIQKLKLNPDELSSKHIQKMNMATMFIFELFKGNHFFSNQFNFDPKIGIVPTKKIQPPLE